MTAIDDMVAKYSKEEDELREKMIQSLVDKFYQHISNDFGEEVASEVKRYASVLLYDIDKVSVRFRIVLPKAKPIFVTINSYGGATFITDDRQFLGTSNFPKAVICSKRAYEELEYIRSVGKNYSIPYDGSH